MEKYIAHIIYPEIEKNGFLFLDNDIVYPKKEATELEEQIFILENIENENPSKFDDFLLKANKEKLEYINEYLQVIHHKKFDGRSIRRIRILLVNKLKKYFPEIKVSIYRYAYLENNIELNVIDSLDSFIKFTKNFSRFDNNDLYYRGHSNINWDLKPSIYRNYGYIDNENKMFRDITLRNPEIFKNTKSTFEALTIMQHYGLPTRLLDITKNPLVALFFSCINGNKEFPGEVIIFNPNKKIIKYSDSNNISILSNLSKVNRNFHTEHFNIKDFNNSSSGEELLNLIKSEKPYFTPNINPYDLLEYFIVKPVNNNERIKRQLGHFVLFGISEDVYLSPDITDLTLRLNGKKVVVVINENKKDIILEELNLIGINKDTLFPEIENGTEFIKNKYYA